MTNTFAIMCVDVFNEDQKIGGFNQAGSLLEFSFILFTVRINLF